MRSARSLAVAVASGLAVVVALAGVNVPAQAAKYRSARVVDGDTIQLGNGKCVRLLGYDTPEMGQCGYEAAKAKMADLLVGGVRLVNRSGTDKYGRILAYVKTDEGWDIGTAMLRNGLAVARYDGRDGYGWHPKQKKYRRLDRQNGTIKCTKPSTPKPTSPGTKVYYANCDAARRDGAAPVYRGDPGYGSHLDRDGDGVGCE